MIHQKALMVALCCERGLFLRFVRAFGAEFARRLTVAGPTEVVFMVPLMISWPPIICRLIRYAAPVFVSP